MAKYLEEKSNGESERAAPDQSRHICTEPADPWGSQVEVTALSDTPYPQAAILHLKNDHEVVLWGTRPGHKMYAWGHEAIEVLTYDAYVSEEEARRDVKRQILKPIPDEYRRERGEELEKQFEELRALRRFGKWPQSHELNFRREELSAVYIVYSGGEITFSPAGFRRAAYRAYGPALYFLRQVAEGSRESEKEIPVKLLQKVLEPPFPEKHGELWMVEKARRAVGLRSKPASKASWTDVRWRTVELAVELGWNPSEVAAQAHVV